MPCDPVRRVFTCCCCSPRDSWRAGNAKLHSPQGLCSPLLRRASEDDSEVRNSHFGFGLFATCRLSRMAIFSSLSRLNDVLRFDYLRGNLIVKDRALRALFLAGRRGYGDHECPVCNVGRAPRQVTRVRSRLPMATCPSLFARIGATPSAA